MIVVPSYFQKLLLFLLIFVRAECDPTTEQMVQRLDSMITEIKPQRISRDTDDGLKIWQEYEFGTGVGNREELIVTDVNIEEVEALSIDGIKNWQYLSSFRHGLFAGSGESSLWLCRRDNEDGRVHEDCFDLTLTERILTFKVISLFNHSSNSEEIVAILCVQSGSETKLHSYKVTSSDGFELVGSSTVARPIERIEFFRINGRNKLLLIIEPMNHDGAINSSIDIYGFGFVGGLLEFWFCQRIQKPRVSSLEICSIYDGTYLSIHSQDTVSLYEFKEEETKEGLFKLLQNVTSNGLKNSVCFENGYTEYLILSGEEPALYTFLGNEFYYDIETEELFNALGEILWIQCLPVETYREECLLLVQLKNFTVIGLSWQGPGFRVAALPAFNIDNFLLSQITVIPKYGFIIGNKIVKVETRLQELQMPVNYEMETILRLKSSLQETFLKQEVILNETGNRIQASYYTNPVITGFWNFAEVVTNTATISKTVTYDSLTVGSKSLSAIDESTNVTVLNGQFRTLDDKIEKISLITGAAVRADSPEVHIEGLLLNGGIEVTGTTNVNNLTFEYLNGLTLNDIIKDFVNFDDAGFLIKGIKSFPSIEASHINVGSINGVPLEDVEFATENLNYESIDFTLLNQLVVNGDLTVPKINGITWNDLMKKVVWITESTTIPGSTIIRGEVSADTVVAGTLNGLRYPEDYVLQNSTADTKISGLKTFGDVKVGNLKGMKSINGIPYEDFVTLNSEQTLPNQITFKNLTVGENLKIDGRVTGIEVDREDHRLTLSDTNIITADTTFTNLYVTGNIIVENSVNGKLLSDFDDILQKSEEQAVINGQKTFRGNVEIETTLKVSSKKYNGHPIDEFATFSGEQVFPNLRNISVPVTFEVLEYKQLSDLENYLSDLVHEIEDSECSRKKLNFNVPPIFDDISFHTLNGDISVLNFSKNVYHTFSNVIFEDLRVKNVYADAVTPNIINGVDFADFEKHRISVSSPQVLTGNYNIWNLEAGNLVTERINGMTLDELEEFRNAFEDLFNKIWNGRMAIETFIVKGNVRAKSINGELLADIYSRNQPRNLIVGDGFDVDTLEVHGFVNGLNLTEFVADSVFKTDSEVFLTGEKTFDNLDCQIIEFPVLNGIPVANIVNPNVVQILTGPVAVKGNVLVEKSFSSDGKINDVIYKQLIDRFSYSGSNTLELHGNFRFVDNCDVENLQIDGPIQGISFDSFLETAIFRGDDVHISGSKTFTNSVTFGKNFTISNEYNGVDLGPFNHKAVFTDKEIHIGCEIIFKQDLMLAGDLIVEEKLTCKTMSHVDIEELMSSAIFLDRPSYVPGTLTFTNATFESGMTVGYLNGIDLNSVITLKEDQTIFEPLLFVNVSVQTLDTTITVNGHTMDQIFANTFMLFGNQTITGNVIFHGNVQMLNNFDLESLNGVIPSQMVSRDGDETLTGTFEFTSPLILWEDFRVFGLVNGIDLDRWESEAVSDEFPQKQLVTGNWFIRGNVTFEKNVLGSGLLNGIDVRRLFDEVETRNLEVETMVNGVKMDLQSTCKDLTPLQKYAKNQIHRFKFFEYLQIFEFNVTIQSVHHFELDDVDLLLINLDNCFLNTLFYNGSEFTFVQSKNDFDNVEKWTTLKYKGAIYFLTMGSGSCGRSIGNLWRFEQETMVHILDLGSIIDVKKIGDYVFLVIFKERLEKWSIEDVHNGIYGNSTSYFATNEHMHFVPNTDRILIVADDYIHEFHHQFLNHTSLLNHFGNGASLGLRAGIHEREMFLYYNERFSENTAFIFDDLPNMKIRQSIPIHRPNSFLSINFDSRVETFLTFVQNGRSLEIFEYKGIEGFVYRESIKMQVDRTFGLKLRKQPGLSKTNMIGAIHGKTLKIIEAQMYGEKWDGEYLNCENSL